MTTIDITYGKEKIEDKEARIPMIGCVYFESQQLRVVKSLLEGTKDNEWLKIIENVQIERIQNG